MKWRGQLRASSVAVARPISMMRMASVWTWLWSLCCFICLLASIDGRNQVFAQESPPPPSSPPPPHIILILADDMGFNDVSFHGADQIPTPNIDALAYHGTILNRHYVAALCTPSRAALLTGRYPIHTGMQHFVIASDQPYGLPTGERLLPEYLREHAGYRTSLVGKWHLGMARKEYTPTHRGFDEFRGYLGPYIDFYNHSLLMGGKPYAEGYDMRNGEEVSYEDRGKYVTDVLTDYALDAIKGHSSKNNNGTKPLFLMVAHMAPHSGNDYNPLVAPPPLDTDADEDRFAYIQDPKRRIYAAMVTRLDESVGRIVDALHASDMLENSVIVFMSDNGAPTRGMHHNTGSNFPLRGQKHSPWEGGVRGAAAIWSPLLQTRHVVSSNIMYIADWLPTLAHVAGIDGNIIPNIDGLNQWEAISENHQNGERREIVHNIDPIVPYTSFFRDGYKYINGTTHRNEFGHWFDHVPETDLPAGSYLTTLRNSTTWSILSRLLATTSAGKSALTDDQVTALRNASQVTCGDNTPLVPCHPIIGPCLFDVIADPCEMNNLADENPSIMAMMEENVQRFVQSSVAPVNRAGDPNCDPRRFNNTWTWWLDEEPSNADPLGAGSDLLLAVPATVTMAGLALV